MSTNMREEMNQSITSQGSHSQGKQELVDLLVVLTTLEGWDDHDAGQTHQANHHHTRDCTKPALCWVTNLLTD